MRRANREVTQIDEIVKIIEKCDVCRIAMVDGGIPYIVPMNFGYEMDGKTLTLYFHCAGEGRKIDILKQNSTVCFEMDCGHELIAGDFACDYSYKYESLIGNGCVEFIEDYDAKISALSKIMCKYTGKSSFDFDENAVRIVTAFKVKSTDFTAKRR